MAADTTVVPAPNDGTVVVNQTQYADDPSNPTDASTALIGGLPAVIKESKAGYKTTEFWASIVAAALVLFEVVPATGDTEGVLIGVITAVYALSRGIAKKETPHVEVTKDEA